MNRFLFFCLYCSLLLTNTVPAQDSTRWIDLSGYQLEGQAIGYDYLRRYDRLPKYLMANIREELADLGHHSAGLAIRFDCDATELRLKWNPAEKTKMPHMTALAMSGFDLYARDEQGKWRWAAAAKVWGNDYQVSLLKLPQAEQREYLLYFPLYDGVDSVFIGINEGAIFQPAKRPRTLAGPLVFYGTSITQGCSASRPGMTYAAIAGRKWDAESFNFGFSGNGRMDTVLVDLFASIPASAFIIDCLPNMNKAMLADRGEMFIRKYLQASKEIPIVLIAGILYENAWLSPESKLEIEQENQLLLEIYGRIKKEYPNRLFYLAADDLIGSDGEGTIDGVHFTDVGFMRMAKKINQTLETILPNTETKGE
jgi:hypothetical protein